jgi:hypothetical protein
MRLNWRGQMMKIHNKHVCEKCGWHGSYKEVLQAPNPLDKEEILFCCPKCKQQEVVWACDAPYCFAPVSCGTPTPEGYKNLCLRHYDEYKKKRNMTGGLSESGYCSMQRVRS